MDIEEFKRLNEPKARRSRLDLFRTEIFDLRLSGYSHDQIAEWLKTKSIEVSTEAIRKYVKKHASQFVPVVNQPGQTSTSPTDQVGEQRTGPNSEASGLSAKERGENRANEFIKAETTNPLIKRIQEKKK